MLNESDVKYFLKRFTAPRKSINTNIDTIQL